MKIDAGSTNKSVYVYFVDDDGGTAPGEPTTGLLFSDIETGGSASYMRQGAARTDFTLVTLASAAAAHADGGFILVDDTNMPGLYRVDVPDAAFAAGVDFVVIQLVAAAAKNTVMRPLLIEIGTEAKASVCTEARLAELDAANLPTDVAGVKTDTAAILVDTGTTIPGVLGTPAGLDMSADIAAVKADSAAILVDTGTTLDGKIDAIAGYLDTEIAAILTDTGTTIPALIAALNDISAADILTTALTESYAADGAAPTLSQALFAIMQQGGEFAISGTTITVKKLNGTTTAMTFTLDDATNPTSRTRAT